MQQKGKTNLIAYTNGLINTKEKFVCVSRPRRFGKSMTLEMLAAYYSCGCDSADLFRGRKIENDDTFLEHLNQYDVIFLNMQQFLSEAAQGKVTEYLMQEVLRDLKKEYGEILLVGINYDRKDKNKPHSCVIQRVEKER